MARKSERQRRRAAERRAERREDSGKLETWLEQYQRELEEGVPDYSPRAGYLRTQRWSLALIEELEMLIDKKPGSDVSHGDVGTMACIRVHLEKAVAHAKGLQGCLLCPAKDRQ